MMKRNIKQLSLALVLGLTTTFSGCSDNILAELTSLETSRLFSVTGLDARVVNQTQVRLNFKAVKNADSYVAEFFEGANPDFSGTPVLIVADITAEQLPYVVVSGLVGETTYTVRVKAVGEGVGDSKWMTAVITTGAEQIFRPVAVADIEANEVILRWTAGEVATQIVLEPGNITHAVTAQEIEAGAATITGLTPETTYTARLLNNGGVRGTISFTTLLDLGGAILVESGADLVAAIAAADPGATLALEGATFVVGATVDIDKSITLRSARPAERATIQGAVFRPISGASLTLADLNINGNSSANPVVTYNTAGTFAHLTVENCQVYNYQRGLAYSNTAGVDVQKIEVRNSIFHDMTNASTEFIDFRPVTILRELIFVNNTLYNVASPPAGIRYIFRIDNSGTDFNGQPITITVTNNTFYNVSGTGNAIVYVRRAPHTVDFSKNIVASTLALITATGGNATTFTTFANNNFYNTANITATGTNTSLNPGFADPANGNFTISQEDLRFNQIGDPRWIQ